MKTIAEKNIPGNMAQIERLKKLSGVHTDRELAALMGVSYKTISGWKKRGIALKKLSSFCRQHNIDLRYVLDATSPIGSPANAATVSRSSAKSEYEERIEYLQKQTELLQKVIDLTNQLNATVRERDEYIQKSKDLEKEKRQLIEERRHEKNTNNSDAHCNAGTAPKR